MRSFLSELRNQHAFHFDQKAFAKGWSAVDEKEILVDYLATIEGNTVLYSSDAVQAAALHQMRPEVPLSEFFEQFGERVQDATHQITTLISAYRLVFSERYLSDALADLGEARIRLADQHSVDTFTAPVFLSTGDSAT